MLGSFISAVAAGLLTSFSPCVISAVPFVVSSSLSENKKGPIYLVIGLISSFVILGVLFALSTKFLGFEQETLKKITSVMLIVIGLSFLIPTISGYFSKFLSPIANSSNNFINKIALKGNMGQFLLGFLFGFIWSPCSGPTLGYALTLVAKENEIFLGASIMLVYGVSASLPLLFVAYISRSFIQKNMKNLNSVYSYVKKGMGLFLLLLGGASITGIDKSIEIFLLNIMPSQLLDLITKF